MRETVEEFCIKIMGPYFQCFKYKSKRFTTYISRKYIILSICSNIIIMGGEDVFSFLVVSLSNAAHSCL